MGLAGEHTGLHQVPAAAGQCQVQETEGCCAACSVKVNSSTLQGSIAPAERGTLWHGARAPALNAVLLLRGLQTGGRWVLFSATARLSPSSVPPLHRPHQWGHTNGCVSAQPSGDSFLPAACLEPRELLPGCQGSWRGLLLPATCQPAGSLWRPSAYMKHVKRLSQRKKTIPPK